jgi:hypothetical protein
VTDDEIDEIAAGAGAVWVAVGNGVLPLDPRTGRRAGRPIVVGGLVRQMVVTGNSVWVLVGTGYDPRPPPEPGAPPDSVIRPKRDGSLVRIDARSRRVVVRRPKVSPSPGGVAAGEGLLWVTDTSTDALTRLDPLSGRQAGPAFRESGVHVAVGDGRVWVVDPRNNQVKSLDARSGRRLGLPVKVPDPEGNYSDVGPVVTGAGSAWVGSQVDKVIGRISP